MKSGTGHECDVAILAPIRLPARASAVLPGPAYVAGCKEETFGVETAPGN
jgi:hypothetical protein